MRPIYPSPMCSNCGRKDTCKPYDAEVTETYQKCYKYPEMPLWIQEKPGDTT